ncbi:MAG: hypothetical protein QXU44_08790 [Candidatus Caldarchaeum sp.]
MFEDFPSDNYVLDVSAFMSVNHLRDIIEILSVSANREKTTLILPTILYHELVMTQKGEISPLLRDIIYKWRRGRYYMGYANKQEYKYIELVRWFFNRFTIQPAENIVGKMDKIGERTLKKYDVVLRLGSIVGSIVFEMLAVSHKLKCPILAFGTSLISLVRELEITTVMYTSRMKDKIKRRANIKRTLRILGYITTLETAQRFLADMIPDPSIVGIGLLLIADG